MTPLAQRRWTVTSSMKQTNQNVQETWIQRITTRAQRPPEKKATKEEARRHLKVIAISLVAGALSLAMPASVSSCLEGSFLHSLNQSKLTTQNAVARQFSERLTLVSADSGRGASEKLLLAFTSTDKKSLRRRHNVSLSTFLAAGLSLGPDGCGDKLTTDARKPTSICSVNFSAASQGMSLYTGGRRWSLVDSRLQLKLRAQNAVVFHILHLLTPEENATPATLLWLKDCIEEWVWAAMRCDWSP